MSNEVLVIQDKYYPLKVWITTIVSASILFVLYDFFRWGENDSLSDFFGTLTTSLLFNVLLSLPSLAIFFLGFEFLNKNKTSIILKRITLILFAFSLFLFTWYVINSMFGRDVFLSSKSMFIYCDFILCITISSLIYGKATPV